MSGIRRTLYTCTMSYDLVCDSAFVLSIFLNALRDDVAKAHPDYTVTAESYTNDDGSVTIVVDGEKSAPAVDTPAKWRGARAGLSILDEWPQVQAALADEN